MSILVTGGTGFIGAELVRQLVERGEKPIVFRSSTAKKLLEDVEDRLTLVQGSIANFSHVLNTVKSYNVSTIYHLGGMLSMLAEENPWAAFEVNLRGTFNILEAARLYEVKQFIFSSSRGTYGLDLKDNTVDDYSLQRPDMFYGCTKLFGELAGRFYRRKFGIDFRGVRLPSIMGPGVKTPGVVQWTSWVVENAYRGKPFNIWTTPETIVPCLYYKDAASSMIQLANAAEDNIKMVVYNLAGIQPLFSAQDLVSTVKEHFPDADIGFEPDVAGVRKARSGVSPNIDDHLAREEWGWTPRYSLQEAINDFIEELRRNPHRYA